MTTYGLRSYLRDLNGLLKIDKIRNLKVFELYWKGNDRLSVHSLMNITYDEGRFKMVLTNILI